MKKIILSLIIGIFTLGFVSCSSDNDDFTNYKSNDIVGIYQVTDAYNCNVNLREYFTLFNSHKDYISNVELTYTNNDDVENSYLGDFYSTYKTGHGYPAFEITKYYINNDELTIYIRNGNFNVSDYEFKYQFKITEYTYHKSLTLTCTYSTYNEMLTINEGAVIKLKYLGYNMMEVWNSGVKI